MGKIKGGSFILEDADVRDVFTPEDFTEEQRLIAKTIEDFVSGELKPVDERLEKLDYALTVSKMRAAGELGILGAEVPELYGGLGLDKISAFLINEKMSKASSFALTLGGHMGIGMLPIVYFGTDIQKRKYLPSLISGEKIAAYCLTEPGAGSDALGIQTYAVLSEDGSHYLLNGTKQFITNAGFADVFIVYAKVNGTDFSAFIVERTMEGVRVGPEEKKMGLKGTSTCPVTLDNVKVPKENLLGEVGKGHLIAFNILNVGRLKLAAGSLGTAKDALEYSAKYASERTQFGRKLSSFPLIGQKLADMNTKIYVLESMVYRTAGLMEDALKELDHGEADVGTHAAKALAEYAVECSINKVFGTETLGFAADEGVQIHGGYGFIQEYPIERIYRDARVYRIFEGSNEINRLFISLTMNKRAAKGALALWEKGEKLRTEPEQKIPDGNRQGAGQGESQGVLEGEARLVSAAKNLFVWVNALAVRTYGAQLEQEQETLSRLADMLILTYAMESALIRTQKIISRFGEAHGANAVWMNAVFVREAFEQAVRFARDAILGMEGGEELLNRLSALSGGINGTLLAAPVNFIRLKRSIAERVAEAGKYTV